MYDSDENYWNGLKKYTDIYKKLNIYANKGDQTALGLCEQIEIETQPQRGLYIWEELDSWYNSAMQFLQSLDKTQK
jgi:hypothetical protein